MPVACLSLLLLSSGAAAQNAPPASHPDQPRARDLGVPFDGTPGPFNAITDVAGVEVGFKTLISGDGQRVVGKGVKEIVRRFTENLEAIKRLWTEDKVTMKGTWFDLVDANVSVKPVQKPRPPIWIGANADPAIERAAQLGDCWYVNPHNRMDTIEKQVDVYKRALEAAGKPFPAEFPGRRECFVARSREEAIRMCRPYLAKKYEVYHAWGQDKAMPAGDNDLGLEFDELIKDRFFLGGPDEVAEQIVDYTRKTGINHHILSCQWPGMPQRMVLDTLQLLAEEVFPRVRQGL